MPDLTIRFIDEPDVVSRLITWATNSLWCHCEALSRDGNSWIGAHIRTGVQARPLNWVKPVRERVYSIPVSAEDYRAANEWLEARIGVPYDYLGILGLAVHRRFHGHGTVDCSNLMTGYLRCARIQALNTLPEYDYLITPEMLHLSPVFIGRCVHSK